MIRLGATPLWLRLLAATLLLVTLAITLSATAGTRLLQGYLVDRIDRQLEGTAATVGRRLTTGPIAPRPPPFGIGERGAYYAVIIHEGRVISLLRPEVPARSLPDLAGFASREAREPFDVPSADGATQWRTVVQPVPGGRQVVIASSLAEVEGIVSRLVLINLGVGLAVLAGLGAAGYALIRVSLRPLVEIEHTAEAIAAGDLTRRIPRRDSRTEVGRLGGALNGMLARLEGAIRSRERSESAARASEQRMRRFVADASHELRTPLTSIRGFAELYRQDASADPGRLMRRIEDEGARMGELVDDLLLLAHLDQQRPLRRDRVDVVALAAEAALDARALAPDREIELLRVAGGEDEPVTVVGDEVRLRQILGNLVRNALTHTPPGTPFTIGFGIHHDSDRVEVNVADAGPGMPPEQAARVFERFYRADASRSRAQGGTGLGLSIVAALAQAHGGSAEVITAPGEGAVFKVFVPSAAAGADEA